MSEITQDGLNDIRMAIGAIVNNLKDINEKLDDVTAMALRSARLAELADDVESIITDLPTAIRSIGSDPMIGSFLGPTLDGVATDIERAVADRRQRRASAPAIEG